jgi:hypothetical protein
MPVKTQADANHSRKSSSNFASTNSSSFSISLHLPLSNLSHFLSSTNLADLKLAILGGGSQINWLTSNWLADLKLAGGSQTGYS